MKNQAVVLAMTSIAFSSAISAKEFYVSPQGSDSSLGTKELPFKTIAYAQSQVRAWKQANADEDITVNNSGALETFGFAAEGIHAESIGGGGGHGGTAKVEQKDGKEDDSSDDSPPDNSTDEEETSWSVDVKIGVGGSGGEGVRHRRPRSCSLMRERSPLARFPGWQAFPAKT